MHASFTSKARPETRRNSSSTCGPRSSLAFTLVEMMVVTGMLAILMGVAFSGIGQARKQAKIAKASAEVRELVNAFLAYETEEEQLDIAATPKDATEANLKELLGQGKTKTVYLNAQMVKNAFRDPWGTPYQYRVLEEDVSSIDANETRVSAAITFPNRHREVRW